MSRTLISSKDSKATEAPELPENYVTIQCWYIHREYERPEGLGQYEVANIEVNRAVTPPRVSNSDLDPGGSIIYLKSGGLAYCHRTPSEVAKLCGLQPARKG